MLLVLRSASDLSARPRASHLAASSLSFPIREVELGLPDSPIHQILEVTVNLGVSSKVILPMEIKATKVMDKHHKAILAMGRLLILRMGRTMAATPVTDKANQVIRSPTVVMRIKSRAHMASHPIITRDNKTRNHQEAKVEECLHMTSQTMVNKIHITSSQAMITIKAHMTSSQITISSMIPIIKTSSPTIHKGKITATTHKMTVVM